MPYILPELSIVFLMIRTPCKPFCSRLLWPLQHLLGFLLCMACSFSGHILLLLVCPFQTSKCCHTLGLCGFLSVFPLCMMQSNAQGLITVFMHVTPQFMSLVQPTPFHIIVPIFSKFALSQAFPLLLSGATIKVRSHPWFLLDCTLFFNR